MASEIYTSDSKKIVNLLQKARREAGLTQIATSKLLNKTQSYVSKIESGQRRIDLIQLKHFAKIYKKSLSFFIKFR
jgi:transcriptional regulator with XRE-family HTH domain